MLIKNTGRVTYAGVEQPFAKAVVCNGLVFCSGVGGELIETGEVRSPDVLMQYKDALDKIGKYLEEAGTNLENIIWMCNFDKTMEPDERDALKKAHAEYYREHAPSIKRDVMDDIHIDLLQLTRRDYFREHAPLLKNSPPTHATAQVSALYKPSVKVEVLVIAAMPGVSERKTTALSIFRHGTVVQPAGVVSYDGLVFSPSSSGRLFETGEVRSLDVAVQTRDSLDKIKDYLESAGVSIKDIVWMFNFITDMHDRTAIMKAREDYFREHAPSLLKNPPAITEVHIPALAHKDYKMAQNAIAVKSQIMGSKNLGQVTYAGVKQPFVKAVACDGWVFCSSVGGDLVETGEVRSTDVAVQTRDSLDKVKQYLEEAGTSLENIVWMLSFTTDERARETVVKARQDYFRQHVPSLVDQPPAISEIQVNSLRLPSMKVEQLVIAGKPG